MAEAQEEEAGDLVLSETVKAAGGVVVRRSGRARHEVALVHRPAYDDWTFPKGKLTRGERAEAGALREVREETGLTCELGRLLGDVRYRDRRGRDKVVTYWLMRPTGGRFSPTSEVDRMRWVSVEDALEMLSYEHDRALLEASLEGPAR